jgi:hypothetical protein
LQLPGVTLHSILKYFFAKIIFPKMPIPRKLTNLEKHYFAQKAKAEAEAKEKAEKEQNLKAATAASAKNLNPIAVSNKNQNPNNFKGNAPNGNPNAFSSSKTPGKTVHTVSGSSNAPVLLQERTGKPPKNSSKEVEMKDVSAAAASGSKPFKPSGKGNDNKGNANANSSNNDADNIPRAGAKRRVFSEEPGSGGKVQTPGSAGGAKRVKKVGKNHS